MGQRAKGWFQKTRGRSRNLLRPRQTYRRNLIIIGKGGRRCVVDKEAGAQRRINGRKAARRGQRKEVAQIVAGASIGKVERSFLDVEDIFDQSQDAAEIVLRV